jgi:hypothetical protein
MRALLVVVLYFGLLGERRSFFAEGQHLQALPPSGPFG